MSNAASMILSMGVMGGMGYLVYKTRQVQPQTTVTIQPASFTPSQSKGFAQGGSIKDLLLSGLSGALVESNGGGLGDFLSGIFGGTAQPVSGGGTTAQPTSTDYGITPQDPVFPPDGKRGFGSLEPLLALIRKHESRGNYDAYYTGVSSPPPRRLTTMSVKEVLAWQDRIDRTSPSEAAGAYQILEDTLRGLVRKGKVFLESPYDKTTQDSLAKELLFGRGLQRYRSGQISANTFANNIAKEWASFPVVTGSKAGRSFYAGDGLNRSSVSVSKSLAAVRSI